MVVGTRKSNADAHPGRILLASQNPRRTRKQIEEDCAHKEAEATAASEDAKRTRQAIVNRIAQLEAEEEQREEDIQTHSQRPDLFHGSSNSGSGLKSLSQTPYSGPKDDDEDDDEDDDMYNPDLYSPPASTVLDDYAEDLTSAGLVNSDDVQVDICSEIGRSEDSDDSEAEVLENVKKTGTRRTVPAVRLGQPS
jgi:hypothetical protein